jgi:hypothetical protein
VLVMKESGKNDSYLVGHWYSYRQVYVSAVQSNILHRTFFQGVCESKTKRTKIQGREMDGTEGLDGEPLSSLLLKPSQVEVFVFSQHLGTFLRY